MGLRVLERRGSASAGKGYWARLIGTLIVRTRFGGGWGAGKRVSML